MFINIVRCDLNNGILKKWNFKKMEVLFIYRSLFFNSGNICVF